MVMVEFRQFDYAIKINQKQFSPISKRGRGGRYVPRSESPVGGPVELRVSVDSSNSKQFTESHM